MATRGAKVERNSVSEQPHELKYEAKKKAQPRKTWRPRSRPPAAISAPRSKRSWKERNKEGLIKPFCEF